MTDLEQQAREFLKSIVGEDYADKYWEGSLESLTDLLRTVENGGLEKAAQLCRQWAEAWRESEDAAIDRNRKNDAAEYGYKALGAAACSDAIRSLKTEPSKPVEEQTNG